MFNEMLYCCGYCGERYPMSGDAIACESRGAVEICGCEFPVGTSISYEAEADWGGRWSYTHYTSVVIYTPVLLDDNRVHRYIYIVRTARGERGVYRSANPEYFGQLISPSGMQWKHGFADDLRASRQARGHFILG